MSVDIYLDKNGDLQQSDTTVFKAENILNVQVGTLYYAKSLGIDLIRFIEPNVEIQPETFSAYMIQTLVNQNVRVDEIVANYENDFIARFLTKVSEPVNQEGLNNV